MKHVEPKVFLIAYTHLDDDAVKLWLDHVGGLKALDHITGDDGEQLIELAGRNCYRSFDLGINPNISKIRTDSSEYHKNILNSAHGSVLEHATCSFAFEDCSRVFTHEMVRSRAGTAFAQVSLRYVRLNDIPMWIPDIISDNKEALAVFEEVIEKCEWGQKELARIYDIDNVGDFHQKKLLTSAFRRIAPIGLATGIVVTFNIRSLRWVIQMRTSAAAEIEIRKVFCDVYNIVKGKYAFLFQDFEEIDTKDGLFEAKPKYSKV